MSSGKGRPFCFGLNVLKINASLGLSEFTYQGLNKMASIFL